MSYRYFASRTIYQVVASLEILFSTVILIFSSVTLFHVSQVEDEEFQAKNRIVLYSGALGIFVGAIQIISAIALVWSSRDENSFDKDDLAVSRIPTIWFFLAFITFSLLILIFLGPILQVEKKGALNQLEPPLRDSLTQLFTYVVANAIFKFLFIWAVYTTIRCCPGRNPQQR